MGVVQSDMLQRLDFYNLPQLIVNSRAAPVWVWVALGKCSICKPQIYTQMNYGMKISFIQGFHLWCPLQEFI